MQIFVKGPEKTRVITMERAEKGTDLQGKVEEKFGITRNFQKLSYSGKPLVEDIKLDEVLTDGCTVHLAMPMFGGRGSAEPSVDNGWLDLYSFDDMIGYFPERPESLRDVSRPGVPAPASDDNFVDVPALPDDDLADFDMDADSMEFLNETVQACDVTATNKPMMNKPMMDLEYHTDGSASTPDTVLDVNSPCSITLTEPGASVTTPFDPKQIWKGSAQQNVLDPSRNDFGSLGAIKKEPTSPGLSINADDEDILSAYTEKVKRTKGVAYDLDSVDDKMRRRLIKNRQSAERSRLKKNALMKELEEELHKSRMENVALKRESDKLKTAQSSLQDENASLRALLEAHGVSLDAARVA